MEGLTKDPVPPKRPVGAWILALLVYAFFFALIVVQAKLRGETGTGQTVVVVLLSLVGLFMLMGLLGALVARRRDRA